MAVENNRKAPVARAKPLPPPLELFLPGRRVLSLRPRSAQRRVVTLRRPQTHRQQLKHALTLNAAHVITHDYLMLSQPLAEVRAPHGSAWRRDHPYLPVLSTCCLWSYISLRVHSRLHASKEVVADASAHPMPARAGAAPDGPDGAQAQAHPLARRAAAAPQVRRREYTRPHGIARCCRLQRPESHWTLCKASDADACAPGAIRQESSTPHWLWKALPCGQRARTCRASVAPLA
eukprot:3713269-Pleurochrysis_carterae.AAC.4